MKITFGIIAFFVSIFVSMQSYADGWAMFSQHDQMKNYVIVDVGEVSKVGEPFNTKFENDIYQINGHCFIFSGYVGYWGYGKKAAMLLINAQKNIQIALIESEIGSIKIDQKPITLIKCP